VLHSHAMNNNSEV